MVLDERTLVLKDGSKCVVRSPRADEAVSLIEYLKTATSETDFLLRNSEDSITVEDEEKWIESGLSSPTKYNISVYADGKVVGGCSLYWSGHKKIAHRASVGIAILREYWNKGLGTALFRIMEEIAVENNLRQMELSYIEGNERGKRLYEKRGFREVGRIPNAFLMKDGTLRADVMMIKEI